MRAALSKCCVLGIVLVAFAALAAPALADPSTPTGLTAVARSDHRVDLSWSWPVGATYPDIVEVVRDGGWIAQVSPFDTGYSDTSAPTAGTPYGYQLVTLTDNVASPATPVPAVQVTTRADAPNAPTNVHATFDQSNIATVTWNRGAADADVQYNVTAQPTAGGPPITQSVPAGAPGAPGTTTLDGFANYAGYKFDVTAVENANDPPGDPGQTTPDDVGYTTRSNDITSPSLNGTITATRQTLGTIGVSWPAASDSGSGVDHYVACVDGINCVSLPYTPLVSPQTAVLGNGTIPNDGANHTVTVVAYDASGNASPPLSAQVLMPRPATPVIALSGGDGCAPLIANLGSSDGNVSGLTFQLLANGVAEPVGSEITGTPYGSIVLTATATYDGTDQSLVATSPSVRVFDPTGPDTSPQFHSQPGATPNSETLSWDEVTAADGAPVVGYQVSSSNIPGYTGAGVFVPQSGAPSLTIMNLGQSANYDASVATVDACGRQSAPTSRTFWLGDSQAPTVPVITGASTTGSAVHLVWSPSSDNVEVDDYRVYRDGKLAGTTPLTSFDDRSLPDAATYSYTVVAVDTNGNASAPSAARVASTIDTTPPTVPGAIRPSISGGLVTLSWGAATDNVGVAGYQVEIDSRMLGQVSSTAFTDKSVPAGDHVFQVRAVDAQQNASAWRTTGSISTNGAPTSTAASTLKVISSGGAKMMRVGGKRGTRLVLTFTLKQPFTRAKLRVKVVSGKAKLRVSLPAGTGRTTPGKRIAERAVKKGTVSIPIGNQKAGTLRLVITTSGGGLVTLGGTGSSKPTILPGT
ncbi:MAG TPA: fibronectin type III domain-containing protein [Gaiellales bacterium]|jgi:chitodextrinase